MSELLSGFIGALIATLLSVLYLYISGQKKLRADVMLEVVSYCDDIYWRLVELHTHKNAEYTQQKAYLNTEEYRIISRELSALLLSSKTSAKLVIAYGEGDAMAAFNGLWSHLRLASGILRKATRSAWHGENAELQRLFSERIDPLRKSTERFLLSEIRASAIVVGFFKRPRKTNPKGQS